MNLVFFDIECASVNKNSAKICAFGYVVCDENFNIVKKEDILINPRGKFRLTDRSGDKGLILPYSYGDFKNYPPFTKIYPQIKSLLEDGENIVLGHSTMNDIKYLNLETRRFKLPSFNFSFSDSQLIYMTYINDFTRQFGLEHIASELGVEFTPHRAADDAYATMRVVEAMCRAKNLSYSDLIKLLRVKEGKIKNYAVTPPSSEGEREYQEKILKLKRERAEKRIKFFNYVSRKKIKRDGEFFGKTFTFSREIEDDLQKSLRFADLVYENGGKYSQHVTQSDFYVCDTGDSSPRTQSALKLQNLIVIHTSEFENMFQGDKN